ncbi:hypothetical protein VPH35_085581 [Triticum aestivum]
MDGGGFYAEASPDPRCWTASAAGAPFPNLLFLSCRRCFFLVLASGAGRGPGPFVGDSSWWRGMSGGGSGGPTLKKACWIPKSGAWLVSFLFLVLLPWRYEERDERGKIRWQTNYLC